MYVYILCIYMDISVVYAYILYYNMLYYVTLCYIYIHKDMYVVSFYFYNYV